MGYREDARKKIATLFAATQEGKIAESILVKSTRDRLMTFLSSPVAVKILEFASEFKEDVSFGIGYLYDPVPNHPEIIPLHQASNKPLSQYYCAKISIGDSGSVFIIPIKSISNGYCIVFKPPRNIRQATKFNRLVIDGCPIVVSFPPFAETDIALSSWSLSVEAKESFK